MSKSPGINRPSGADFPAVLANSAPVGVFDSGVGGLSVLRHIRAQLPDENLLYFADTGFAPYGDKPVDVIVQRSLAIADFLLLQGAKALVVACNTATAASIAALRLRYPGLIIVGVEPGLKPAAAHSKSKIVGVLATKSTLESAKFQELKNQLATSTDVQFLAQACVGLVDRIERGELQSPATADMIRNFVRPLVDQGADTLVLGCTHYPFVLPLIQQAAGSQVHVVDTGEAVTRHLQRLLAEKQATNAQDSSGTLHAYTTASASGLTSALQALLKLQHTEEMVTALQLGKEVI